VALFLFFILFFDAKKFYKISLSNFSVLNAKVFSPIFLVSLKTFSSKLFLINFFPFFSLNYFFEKFF